MPSTRIVNCFEVPAGREEDFLALFREVNGYMRAKPGFIGHQLHRSLAPDAHFRFVNLVEWESPERLGAARDDEYHKLISKPEWSSFASTAAVYEVVHESHV